ncbi:unnamed protein product [Sphagnum jensenii]|uniref:Uncharacterized protein n=1 Tax=Sphagnum jensenii TaxID=128206 RepID=A0ABP1BB39_9BRYO
MAASIVKFRLAENEDIVKVTQNFHEKLKEVRSTFGKVNVAATAELCLCCVVGIDANDKVVAFGAIDDRPSLPQNLTLSNQARDWAIQEASDLGYLSDSMMWLRVCVSMPDNKEDEDSLLKETLHALFSVSPTTQVILHIGQ